VNYGIAPWAHELLGPGWIDADGKGETVKATPIDSARLAQRALSEVFEQMERVARVGRERCLGGDLYSSAPLTDEQLITRSEAVDTLRMLGDALDYARVHLDYLRNPKRYDKRDDTALPYGVGDVVEVQDDSGPWRGEVTGFCPTHESVDVMVRDEGGEVRPVDSRDIRVARPSSDEARAAATAVEESERPF
jgi:hypothetical protein